MRKLLLLLLFCWQYLNAHEAAPLKDRSEIADNAISERSLKVLHLTFHRGCAREFAGIAKALGLDLVTWYIPSLPPFFLDGKTTGNALYNVGHRRAQDIWEKHRDFFEQFDLILTSDTAPLSRIFLQNKWTKPLFIWICNRFDYYDGASLDCHFPDQEYYDLFNQAATLPNVTMIAYTAFEHYYAQRKNIPTGNLIITPCALYEDEDAPPSFSDSINKPDTFFLPHYHNETNFMNFSEFVGQKLQIPNCCRKYNAPKHLEEFKGIIHLPYSWSTLSLFENIRYGIPYFIPSVSFFKHLLTQPNYFHPNADQLLGDQLYQLSEWYCKKNEPIFIYFDSWEDLKHKIETCDYDAARAKIKAFAKEHQTQTLVQWKQLFTRIEKGKQ